MIRKRSMNYWVRRSFSLYIPLLLFLSFTLLPLYWMLVTALKPSRQIFEVPIRYLPKDWTLVHFF